MSNNDRQSQAATSDNVDVFPLRHSHFSHYDSASQRMTVCRKKRYPRNHRKPCHPNRMTGLCFVGLRTACPTMSA